MHYIYVRARRDPDKTWNMGHFQLTLTEMEEIVAEWEPGWWKDLPIQEIVESDVEEEEEVDNKHWDKDDDAPTGDDTKGEDVGKDVIETMPMKPMVGQTKQGKERRRE